MKFLFYLVNEIYKLYFIQFSFSFNETALHIAVAKRNIEIVKLLLKCDKIDVNAKKVPTYFFFIQFER